MERHEMSRRTRIIVPLVLLSALALHGAALAQSGLGEGPGRGPDPGVPKLAPPAGPDDMPGPRGDFTPPPGPGPGPGPLWARLPTPEVLDQLELGAAQRAKIEDLIDTERRYAIRADGEARIAELDLDRLVQRDSTDATAIGKTIEHLSSVRQEMLKSRVAAILAIRAALTPSQRAKLRRPPADSRWH